MIYLYKRKDKNTVVPNEGFFDQMGSALSGRPGFSSRIQKAQEHIVVADADTGAVHTAHWYDSRGPEHNEGGDLVTTIMNDGSMVHFEYTTGRALQKTIQQQIDSNGLSLKQVGLLIAAYKGRYGEELKVTARPPTSGPSATDPGNSPA